MNRKPVIAGLPLIILVLCARGAAQEKPAPRNETIQRSLPFLAKEGAQWMRVRKCASCHHLPMAIWSLNEARNRGYEIDSQILNEVTAWTLGGASALVEAKVLPDPTKPPDTSAGADNLNLAAIYLTLASQADPNPSPAVREGVDRLGAYLVEKQSAEGSWGSANGRPPVSANKEIMTMWTMVVMKSQGAVPSRAKAAEWLARIKPSEDNQEFVLRALMELRAGKSPKEIKPAIDQLLQRQNADGGWSQTKDMPSDAFATGQALYLLSESRMKSNRPEVQRAIAFLTSTQKPDGSWPMQSRPTFAGGGPAKDLSIITYAATAWATIGLVRMSGK